MSLPRTLWRQFAASPLGPLTVALLVGFLAALVAVGPRLAAELDDDQLRHRLSGLSALQGDIASHWVVGHPAPNPSGSEDPWAPYREAAGAIQRSQPQPLRGMLEPAQFYATTTTVVSLTPPTSTGYYLVTLDLAVDPDLAEHAELVAGDWPSPASEVPGSESVTEVTVLESVAGELGWRVGDRVTDGGPVVSGIHRPVDPESSRWQHIPQGNAFGQVVNPDRGVELTATLFLSPRSTGSVDDSDSGSVRVEMWFGVDLGRASGVDVGELRTQLTGMLARQYPMAAPADGGEPGTEQVSLASDLRTALDEVVVQQRTTNSLLLVLAAGPVAMVLALVGLSVRLVTHHRRPALDLSHARGASPRQLRTVAALEGALLCLPAAAVGHLVGVALVPGPRQSLWQWAPTILVAGIATLGLALGAGGTNESGGARADLGSRPGRVRLAGEVLLSALAGVAVWRLVTQPQRAAAELSAGPDLLAAAAPILAAVAACVLALRLYPQPLRVLLGALRRSRGIVGFLGAARALRNPAGGSAPMFAVVLGTTVAVLSTVMLGTIQAGIQDAALDRNGAQVSVSGPPLGEDLLADLRAVEGVAEVSPLHDTRERRRLLSGDGETAVTVWVARPSLGDVYAAAGLPRLPSGFFGQGPEPVVITGGDAPQGSTADLASIGQVRVGAHWDTLPGAPASGAWVLIDESRWLAAGGRVGIARLALIQTVDGFDPAAVADAVRAAAGGGLVTTAADHVERAREQPVVSRLGELLLVLSLVTVAAMAVAVVVAQGMGNRERSQMAGVLRVLGARSATLRALTAWEVLPAVVVALLFGVGLGTAIAALLLAALDFTALTGGVTGPAIAVDRGLLAGVLGAVIGVTAVAVLASSWLAGRSDLGSRTGEDA